MRVFRSISENALRLNDINLFVVKIFIAVAAILCSQFVSVMDSFAIATLLFFQLYIGTQYYLILKNSLNTTVWEAIAIGGSTYFGCLGFAAVLLPRHEFLLIILSVVPLIVMRRRLYRFRKKENNCYIDEDFFQAEWLILTTVFGLSIFNNNFIFLFFCLIIAITIGRKKPIYEKLIRTNKQAKNILFWITFYLGLIICHLISSSRRPFYGLMTPLFRGTDDQIFSEQLSHSLVNFGIHENTAAIGTDVKYHWLSLGWSGAISRISGVEPFVVTLHVIPVISYLMLSILIAYFVSTVTKDLSVSILVTVILFSFQIMGTQIGFIEVLNTSNIFPFIWFLALLIALRDSYAFFNARMMVLVALLAMFCSLGKAPYALTIAVGSIFAFTIHSLKNRFVSIQAFLIQCSVGFPMLIVYIILIRGETYGSAFSFDWKSLRTLFPSPLFIGNANNLGFLISVTTLLIIAIIPAIFLYCQKNHRSESREFNYLMSGVVVAGLFSIFIDAGGSTIYFLSAAIFATILTSTHSLDLLFKSNVLRFRLLILSVAILGPISTLVLRLAKSRSNIFREFGYFSGLGILLQVGLPCCLIFLLGRIWFRGKHDKMIFWTTVASCSLFLASSSAITERLYAQIGSTNIADSNAPKSEIEALKWLRANSQSGDVIVTNRMLCKSSFVCDIADPNTGSSHLISAFSERRVVIEGPRFLAPAPFVNANQYPEWIRKRVADSLEFIDSPNKENYLTMVEYGSSFAYVLKGQTLNRSWTPWASVVYENETVVILKLLGLSTTLPDT